MSKTLHDFKFDNKFESSFTWLQNFDIFDSYGDYHSMFADGYDDPLSTNKQLDENIKLSINQMDSI